MKRRSKAYKLGLERARAGGYRPYISKADRAELIRAAGLEVDSTTVSAFSHGWGYIANRKPPRTITEFRKLGKQKLRRGGRSAAEAKRIHDARIAAHLEDDQRRNEADQRRNYCGILPHLIPLGGHTVKTTDYQRAQNWTSPQPCLGRSHATKIDEGNYKGSYKRYTVYSYHVEVQSFGQVAGGTLRAVIDTDEGRRVFVLRPWRGWRWSVDANGIRLTDSKGRRDYHPTAADLLSNPSTRQIAAISRGRAAVRAEARAKAREELARVRRAESEGATVCFADSMRAGNCRAGTTQWAARHGLDPARHYRPSEVLALANGDTSRVQIVVAVALKRHREEVRRGFCLVADHRA